MAGLRAKTLMNTAMPPAQAIRPQGERLLDLSNTSFYWERVTKLIERYGPTVTNISLSAKDIRPPLTACIDPKTWDITMEVRQNLHFRSDKKLDRFLDKMNVRDPFLTVLLDCGAHEVGHWEFPRGGQFGCPYDNVLYHESFLEPAFDELMKSGRFSEGFCKTWAPRAANAIMDVIDNYNVFSKSSARLNGTGQALFWYLNGQESGYSREYTLFVKLNLALWGNNEMTRLLGQFFCSTHVDEKGKETNSAKEIGQSVSKLSKIFTDGKMMDKESWEGLTREYMRELIKYLEPQDMPEMRMSAGDKSAKGSESDEQGQGGGAGGKRDESQSPGKGRSAGEEEGDGSSGSKEDEGQGSEDGDGSPFGGMSDGDKERAMQERKDKGKGLPYYLGRTEALDALYRSLSKMIRIKPQKGAKPTAQDPMIAVRRRPFDRARDDKGSCDIGKLYLDPLTRKVVPSVVTYRYPVDFPIRKELKDFPEVAFALLDASGTMMGDGDQSTIPWGDRSGYHFGLLSWYGILKLLKRMGIADKVRLSAAIFHSQTHTARGMAECKRLLLNPTSGSTYIDMAQVRKMLHGKENALFPFISDGEIYNWYSVKDEFIELAKKHQFFMIKVFGHSPATRDLQAAGLEVKIIDRYEDLLDLVVDLTMTRYMAAIQKKMEKEQKKYRSYRS